MGESNESSSAGPLVPNYQSGDISWIMMSSGLVFLMAPGVGLFYSGLTKSKNALSMIMLSMAACAVVSIQWLLVGYTLTFSQNGNFLIGGLDKALLFNMDGSPSPGSNKIPDLVFCIYQGMFAVVTPSIIVGSGAGRACFLPTVIFMIIWTTVVYDFIACWVWNPSGWANTLGSLDFAGGSPVHIASGTAALAFAIVLGRRQDGSDQEPENVQNVVIGTIFIWFGWFGFNGGSALASGMRAVTAVIVTNLAASAGAVTLVILEYRHKQKFSPVAFCSGAIIGLVAITPGSGFVGPLASLAFGSFASLVCHILLTMKQHNVIQVDDAADTFIVHGIAGLIGNILTGIFADANVALLDGTQIAGGWVNGNWMQVVYQLAGSLAAMIWSFVFSIIILGVINIIPGLRLRAHSETQQEGIDKVDLGMTIFPRINEMS